MVAQIAPAVRVAVGDNFGIPKGENCFGKLVSALRIMGFDMVFDTSFGADFPFRVELRLLVRDDRFFYRRILFPGVRDGPYFTGAFRPVPSPALFSDLCRPGIEWKVFLL